MERAQLLLKRFHWVLILAMLTVVAKMVGTGVGLVIENALPRAPVRYQRASVISPTRLVEDSLHSRTYYDVITERNLFNSNPPAAEPAEAAPVPTRVIGDLADKAKVHGTIVGDESAMALIEVLAEKNTELYLVGDLILEGAEITRITAEGVYYRQGEQEGLLPLDEKDRKPTTSVASATEPNPSPNAAIGQGGGVEQVSETEYVIDERELEAQLANINQLILQARVVPNFANGKIDGFKIFAIKPNSIFRKLGLRNGDVLLSVNGVVLDNPQKGLQVFQDLQGQRDFAIDLRRRDQNMSFNYEVR